MQKNSSFVLSLAMVFTLLIISGCGPGAERVAEEEAAVKHNVLTEEEISEGWELLFNGRNPSGWRGFRKADLTMEEGWYAHQGLLVAQGIGCDLTGDIVTERQFENFILTTDWRISEGGNSGILYMVAENDYRAIYYTGPEYQILDDLGYNGELDDTRSTAANYGMHAPDDPPVKPAGEWNTAKIVVDNGHVEHWLNGEKVVEYQLWTEEWEELVAAGKWADYPGYGRYAKGHIALQDHGDQVWFRNMKILELD